MDVRTHGGVSRGGESEQAGNKTVEGTRQTKASCISIEDSQYISGHGILMKHLPHRHSSKPSTANSATNRMKRKRRPCTPVEAALLVTHYLYRFNKHKYLSLQAELLLAQIDKYMGSDHMFVCHSQSHIFSLAFYNCNIEYRPCCNELSNNRVRHNCKNKRRQQIV